MGEAGCSHYYTDLVEGISQSYDSFAFWLPKIFSLGYMELNKTHRLVHLIVDCENWFGLYISTSWLEGGFASALSVENPSLQN